MKKKIVELLNTFGLFAKVKFYKDKVYRNNLERQLDDKRYEFYAGFLKRNSYCYDIGANIGNRSEVFLKLGCKVLAAEPQPELVKYLEQKYKNQINIIPKAVGAVEGKASLHLSYDSPLASLSNEWISELKKSRFNHVEWNDTIEVELTTLDSLIKQFGKPDFCKIDVEGFELEVLKGLSQKIEFISFEFTTPEFKDRAIACLDYLTSFGEYFCNYSAGESLVFGSAEWFKLSEFKILFDEFPENGVIDGDIYVKFNK